MHQIFIIFCAILCYFVYGDSALNYMHEGQEVTVDCDSKQSGVITFWFQINKSGAKYLLTVKGTDEKFNADKEKYSVNKNAPSGKLGLAIKSFKKKTDSGLYTCAAMNSNKLFFGEPFEIKGEPDVAPTDPKPVIVTTEKTECTCKKQDPKPIFNCCDTWILSSLACGFVLLLILLIITILYCSRLRSCQCHHTCIIQPQTTPADHSEQLDTTL